MNLTDMPWEWPGGSGAWPRPRLVIITNDMRALGHRSSRPWSAVVATPLDLIVALDHAPDVDTIVVLDGAYAGSRELTLVLLDLYPRVRVVDGDPDTRPRIAGPTSCGISLIAL